MSVIRSYDQPRTAPSVAAALLQLARIKAGLSQRQLAERTGVPATMISAYERDKRQPTLNTLLRIVRAAGYDLRMQLVPQEPHNETLADVRQVDAWRRATPVA